MSILSMFQQKMGEIQKRASNFPQAVTALGKVQDQVKIVQRPLEKYLVKSAKFVRTVKPAESDVASLPKEHEDDDQRGDFLKEFAERFKNTKQAAERQNKEARLILAQFRYLDRMFPDMDDLKQSANRIARSVLAFARAHKTFDEGMDGLKKDLADREHEPSGGWPGELEEAVGENYDFPELPKLNKFVAKVKEIVEEADKAPEEPKPTGRPRSNAMSRPST